MFNANLILLQEAFKLTSMKKHSVRIIAGEWRGRRIPVPDFVELRPSTDRIRETLFNWLAPYLPQARCLDIFSGSGVLGFECLSRGATWATLVDKNPQVIQHLQQQKALFDAQSLDIIQADVLEWLKHPPAEPYDIVFLDPPFASHLWLPTCELLTQYQWLSPQALVYIEHPSSLNLTLPSNWHAYKLQKAGNVTYGLWQFHSDKGSDRYLLHQS